MAAPIGAVVDRLDRALAGVDRGGLGLEIGPGGNPLCAGRPELNVRTLDHMDQAGLKAKYTAEGWDVSRVPKIDYVWNGEAFKDLVGDTKFKWIVASHVIEHVPDIVKFINDCADILAEDGVLSLFVPDKRYNFDYYRALTSLGRLIDANAHGDIRPSAGAVAEHYLNACMLGPQIAWNKTAIGQPFLVHPLAEAQEKFQLTRGDTVYRDVHIWTFTPSSFRLIVDDLATLGLTELHESYFSPEGDAEFFVQLSKRGAGPGLDRVTLLTLTQREQRTV
ncbi:hypothetical protein BH10PSE3_BH10PSE3_35140 [soil metagenome]